MTLQVVDSRGARALQSMTLAVESEADALEITTSALSGVVAGLPFAHALTAVGGDGFYTWSVAGPLPAGLTLTSTGVLSGTNATPGTVIVPVTATDSSRRGQKASREIVMTVLPPPNRAPTAVILAPAAGSRLRVGAPATLAAAAADVDGSVARVDYNVGGVLVASGVAPGFAAQWVVPASGSYAVSAVAVNDDGASGRSAEVTVATTAEVVIYGSEVVTMSGN